jgi:hypothetical protein
VKWAVAGIKAMEGERDTPGDPFASPRPWIPVNRVLARERAVLYGLHGISGLVLKNLLFMG